MSAGYVFFNIAFVKMDNAPDEDAAQRALAWAKENLDWYKDLDEDSDPFELNGSEKLRLAAAEGWEFVGFMTQPAFDAVALGKETEYREDNSGKAWCEKQADEVTGDSGDEAPKDFEITGGVLKKYTGSDEDVSIPGSVTEIGGSAFSGCKSLAEIRYAGTKEQWEAVKQGNDWNKGVPATEVFVRKD